MKEIDRHEWCLEMEKEIERLSRKARKANTAERLFVGSAINKMRKIIREVQSAAAQSVKLNYQV